MFFFVLAYFLLQKLTIIELRVVTHIFILHIRRLRLLVIRSLKKIRDNDVWQKWCDIVSSDSRYAITAIVVYCYILTDNLKSDLWYIFCRNIYEKCRVSCTLRSLRTFERRRARINCGRTTFYSAKKTEINIVILTTSVTIFNAIYKWYPMTRGSKDVRRHIIL